MVPSKFIQTDKTNSSGWINKKRFFKFKFLWQVGGGVFSVSHRNISGLESYIDNQKKHHRKVSFKDECLRLLKHYGISFEEKYLLDFLIFDFGFPGEGFAYFFISFLRNLKF